MHLVPAGRGCRLQVLVPWVWSCLPLGFSDIPPVPAPVGAPRPPGSVDRNCSVARSGLAASDEGVITESGELAACLLAMALISGFLPRALLYSFEFWV